MTERRFATIVLATIGMMLIAIAAIAGGMNDHIKPKSSVELVIGAALKLRSADRLEVTGHIDGPGAATIVLRIDDAASRDYGSRVNIERVFPPGPLMWRTVLGGHITPSGRPIELSRVTRVMAFQAAGPGSASIDSIRTASATALPGEARGFALGAADAPLPEGFERIAPGDARLLGGEPMTVRRPLPDPLAANGLKGLDRVRLPWPEGRARVTIWAEDPGEWELLPHPLHRRIIVNGRVVLDQNYEPAEWVRHRYLRGSNAEHSDTSDAWQAFGRQRANAQSVDVDVGSDGIQIKLDGAEPNARFLSAVLVEPIGERRARDQIEFNRAAWYRETWPVLGQELQCGDRDVGQVAWSKDGLIADRALNVTLAPDGAARLRICIGGLSDGAQVTANLVPSALLAPHIEVFSWTARQRLDRRHAQHSYLTLADHTLHATGSTVTGATPGRADRLFEFWVSATAALPVGRHSLALYIDGTGAHHALPVILDVVDVVLPSVPKPAGVYLDESPHLTWFETLQPLRDRQVACDVKFVAKLGLTGSAPALATPLGKGEIVFTADLARAHQAGLASPALAYATAKRVMATVGPQIGARDLAALTHRLSEKGIDPPIWSIADEPGNPGHGAAWETWLTALRDASGSGVRPKLAGHLNSTKDRSIAGRFDTVLVNPGFGLDVATLAATAASGRTEVWLYNTGAPRLTAGLWLWRTAARRYVQWHARMPTADPFDPIDGREGDEQLILPSLDPCPRVPSIHRDLLDLADGVVDQRWLAWLDSRSEPEARALAAHITRRVGQRWQDAMALNGNDLRTIRESIIGLASRLTDRR